MDVLESQLEVPLHPNSLALNDMVADSEWVRGLARTILGDVALADDLAQETITVALESKPNDPARRRAWLGGILRNRWRLYVRSRSRERRREQRVSRPESVPSHDEVFEQMEVHVQLVDAVLKLREPYRSAIALRYYRELSNAEIARELDLPESTVRVHISRGVQMLRNELDERHEGDRAMWALPLAGWMAHSRVAKATSASAVASVSFWAVAKWTSVTLALGVIVWFAVGKHFFAGIPSSLSSLGQSGRGARSSAGSPRSDDVKNLKAAKIVPVSAAKEGAPSPVIGKFADLDQAIAAVTRPTLDPSDWPIVGRVVDSNRGPVAGVEVTATPNRRATRSEARSLADSIRIEVENDLMAKSLRVTTTTDADGCFELRGLKWIDYAVVASGERGRAKPGDWVDLRVQNQPIATGARVYFELTNAWGQPVQSAHLRMNNGDRTSLLHWQADRDTSFRLLPGESDVHAEIAGVVVSETLKLTSPYTGPQPIKIQLATVSQLIADPIGLRASSAEELELAVLRVDPRHVPDPVVLFYSGTTVHANEESQYVLDVPHGTYLIGLKGMDRVWASRVVDVGGDHRVALTIADQPARTLRVRVRGLVSVPEFKPRFTQRIVTGDYIQTGGFRAISLADGSFLISLSEREFDALHSDDSTVYVGIETPIGTKEVVAKGDEVTFDFQRGSSVRVLMGNLPEEAVSDKHVLRLAVATGAQVSGPSECFALSEEIDLGLVQPGSYELQLAPSAPEFCNMVLAKRPLEVGSSSEFVKFDLPDLHSVTWVIPESLRPRPWIQIWSDTMRNAVMMFGETTEIYLAAGEYRWVRIRHLRARPEGTLLTIPSTTSIEIGE